MNKYKRRAGLLVLSMLLVMAYPMAVFASPATTVSIPDASADYCDEVTVEINITEVIDMGGVDIWLYYDSSVVEVTAVTDGDLGTITFSINNTTGVTKMNWYGTPGETGDFVFANVTLHAVGDPGDTSVLNLEVEVLVNTSVEPIIHDVYDGLFTVTGVPAPAVGGTAYLPNKAGLLAPWIVLGVTLAVVISWLALKRRRARA